MTFHKMLIAERRRELAAKVVSCCVNPSPPKWTPAKQVRLPMASPTSGSACC
jgi:hypothetical protein